jgi:hypothetical protein
VTDRFMYPGDPRLKIVNEMLTQPKLFIGPEGYQTTKSLAFQRLYSPDPVTLSGLYGAGSVTLGEVTHIQSGVCIGCSSFFFA